MFSSPFTVPKIPEQIKVIFVQDFFLDDLVGGAELSMDALLKSAPVHFAAVHASRLTPDIVEAGKDRHWVFGNFATLNPAFMELFIRHNLSYSVFEHDYKFCRWRSIERHLAEGGEECHCESTQWGQLVERFYCSAKQVWFCSQRHMERYFERLPSLRNANCAVLSAVFGEEFFQKIVPLVESLPTRKKSGWLTLDSDSWIKGTDDAKAWLELNNKQYSMIKGMSPDQVLEAMANAEGFVCLPRGADVSNRMVTEAKLLGCQVITNDNVQHVGEDWLEHPDVNFTLRWLYDRRKVFWTRTLELAA
jgi:hypothetical protein